MYSFALTATGSIVNTLAIALSCRLYSFAVTLGPTILDKSLGTLAHFFSIRQGNLLLRPPPLNSMLFNVMNSSLLVSNIVGGGGKGVPNSSDVISYCFENSLSTHFVLSDPGVPRTFVEDCICVTTIDYDMFSAKSVKGFVFCFNL